MEPNHPHLPVGEPVEPVDAFEHAVRRLMWLEQKRMEQLLHVHELTVPQFLVLVTLAHAQEGCPIGDLAGKLFQSNATMTGIVDRLEHERLVARTRGEEQDRRKVMVQVTPKGRHLVEKAVQSRREQTRQALAHFLPDELATFIRLLDRYMEELKES